MSSRRGLYRLTCGMKEAELDWQICSRARLSRDPRFDGKFFIGVHGSGVYCRPICPAPTAKEKNCRYFATAAAASEAGYRPCLRCRPECAPGTPAWLGTSATVARALRLIEERGLHDDGIEGLADRLGVGTRHLRRLFLKHLGASPSAVAQTRRAHFAKKLIDETGLSMTQLAIAAGFGSVRRFNAAIARTFHRTPTQIRATARGSKSLPQNEYVFLLRFRPPFDWQGTLAMLRQTAIPGIEAIGDNDYRRTVSLNGNRGHIHVALDEKQPALRARICFGDPRGLFQIVERIRRIFDLNADWAAIVQTLGSDPLLAPRLHAAPGLRVPGCWDGFELTVRTLVTANANGKGAADLARLVQAYGKPLPAGHGLTHIFPEAQTLAAADLSVCGIVESRARAIRALAGAVAGGRISFDNIVDSAPLLAQLRGIASLSESTAETIAMRALREPDAFPADRRMLPREFESVAALKRHAECWRPWRAYAAICLTADFDGRAAVPKRKRADSRSTRPACGHLPASRRQVHLNRRQTA
jgi:AraC family transcriptional regulator of adaptative response / DNA-3-methyladenine glycosylase II